MGAFFGIIGLLSFIGFVVYLIIGMIKKQPKKNMMIGLGISLAVFFLGIALTPANDARPAGSTQTSSAAKQKEPELTAEEKQVAAEKKAAEEQARREEQERLAKEEKVRQAEIEKKTESEYKAAAGSYTYKEIARNPSDYIGKKAVFVGKVIQLMESGKIVALRVNVTKGSYGIYSDTIYVNYIKKDENEARILEDDIIKIYGECDGIKTYTSTMGGEISIPQINMKYHQIIQ